MTTGGYFQLGHGMLAYSCESHKLWYEVFLCYSTDRYTNTFYRPSPIYAIVACLYFVGHISSPR